MKVPWDGLILRPLHISYESENEPPIGEAGLVYMADGPSVENQRNKGEKIRGIGGFPGEPQIPLIIKS